MRDQDKSKQELLAELELLRERLAQFESADTHQLCASEEKWRAVIKNAPVFIVLVDRDGTILFLNRAQPGMTVEESVGRTVFDYTLPAFHTSLRSYLAAAFDRQEQGTFTSVAAGGNGQNAWYETYVSPVIVADKVVAASFIAIDISHRKRMEAQLSRERNRAQKYLDIAGVILLVLDTHGNIELLNKTGHQLLGYKKGELIGRNWFQTCVPQRDQDKLLSLFHDYLNTNTDIARVEFYESSIVTRSGDERVIAWHNTLVSDDNGERIGTLSSGSDITQQKRTQQALAKAHEQLELRVQQRTAELTAANQRLSRQFEERVRAETQLQAIYDGMVDGLLMADISTKQLVHANSAICRMLGYSAEELSNLTVMDIHPPADLPDIIKVFDEQTNLRGARSDDIPMLRKDGSVFYAAVTSKRIVYAGMDCLLGFFRDITERRTAEDKLQREHRLLRQLLKSQDRERQLIAYEIHDGLAQQLIGAVMQFETVQFVASRNPQKVFEACETGLLMLRKSLAETRRLISGLRPPILDELGVVAAVGHIIHEMSGPDAPDIELDVNIQFDRLEPALENTVYRIVQECLTNAQRYSQAKKIRVELAQAGHRLRIQVSDSGVGFDPSVEREGSFGLEGIKERARLLGGSSSVTSVLGEGTCVTVELPLAGPE